MIKGTYSEVALNNINFRIKLFVVLFNKEIPKYKLFMFNIEISCANHQKEEECLSHR